MSTSSNSAICRFVLNGKVLTGTLRREMESIPYCLVDVDGKRYIVSKEEILYEDDPPKQNEQKAKKRGRPPKKRNLGD